MYISSSHQLLFGWNIFGCTWLHTRIYFLRYRLRFSSNNESNSLHCRFLFCVFQIFFSMPTIYILQHFTCIRRSDSNLKFFCYSLFVSFYCMSLTAILITSKRNVWFNCQSRLEVMREGVIDPLKISCMHTHMSFSPIQTLI